MCRWALAAIALACPPGAAAVDFDDPDAAPLHFALETVSDAHVTGVSDGNSRTPFYNIEAPDGAAFSTTTKRRLFEGDSWYVRVDLDGMVFSAVPQLITSGAGTGSGFESTEGDVLAGGAGTSHVVYQLPREPGFAPRLTFEVLVADTLAVPAGEGRYEATLTLYDDAGGAIDGVGGESARSFGGTRTVVVMTHGTEIDIATGLAVADVDAGFAEFTEESSPTFPRTPVSADAVLGSVSVGVRGAGPEARGPSVYAARGGRPVNAADVLGTVSVTVEGDMTFGTFDLRAGAEDDRCLATEASRGGVLPLSPPDDEEVVTGMGTATLVHADEAFGTRHLCVTLPELEADEEPVPIPIGAYEATVSVAPPGGGEALMRTGRLGEIRHTGTRVAIAHLTASPGYDQSIVIVNNGDGRARYEFVEFHTAGGVAVALTPEAELTRERGQNVVPPGAMVVLPVAATLSITAPEDAVDEWPMTAVVLSLSANERDIGLATVMVNRADGSTDTVVYLPRASVEPEEL